MSLIELVDNTRTDKNTTHSYLDLYEELFCKKKNTAKHVLEVGIGDGNQGISDGGSIKLWRDYFTYATIYTLDIKHIDLVWDGIKNDERIILYTSTDAYNEDFVRATFSLKKFDVMLDDGPHTLDSMKLFIKLYTPLMADDGILIIEDIQHMSWIDILIREVPDTLKEYIHYYDLRFNKSRFDDIVFTINKSIPPRR
jgi:hypothetical protein